MTSMTNHDASTRYIAVASQNRRSVTGHAGRGRRFRVFDASTGGFVSDIELTPEQVLHNTSPGAGHPLGGISVVIAAGMGPGLARRLQRAGIACYASAADDPAVAVADFLAGRPQAHITLAGGECDAMHDHAHCHHHAHGRAHTDHHTCQKEH